MDLVVSCTNDPQNGGIYRVDMDTGIVERCYHSQCMGIARFGSFLVAASQSPGRSPRYTREGRISHSIVCLDEEFDIVSIACVDELGMGDLHDAVVHNGRLWVVDTLGNRIVGFSIRKKRVGLRLGHSHSLVPDLEWIDPVSREPDSSHLNSICFHRGRILVAAFGRFERYREYEGRGYADGCILDVTDAIRPFGSSRRTGDERAILEKLADPHSVMSLNGELWFTEAKRRRVMRGSEVVVELSQGYVRGLACDGKSLYVGRSLSRHGSSEPESQCCVVRVAVNSGRILGSVALSAREVYAVGVGTPRA